jgi:hypothetical protein
MIDALKRHEFTEAQLKDKRRLEADMARLRSSAVTSNSRTLQ